MNSQIQVTDLDSVKEMTIQLVAESAHVSGDLEQLMDFFRGFVDRCHHGKEEDVLFPELEKRGVLRDGGPIGVMLSEHAMGRRHIREIAEALARLRGHCKGSSRYSEERRRIQGFASQSHRQGKQCALPYCR